MALQSNTQIFIGSIPIYAYKHLMLHQEIDAHHSLELVCRMDVLENISGDIASQTKDFLGETITIKITSIDVVATYKELEFKGIVTSVNNTKGFYQQNGDLVSIKAHSCSIITDDGPHYDSHNDVGLSEILDKTFRGYDQSILATSFNPQNSDTLHYSVQHNESAFEYASRLAAQYGEWFYYDGKTLVFGKPEDQDAVELSYGKDLQEFSLQLSPSPNNFKYFTNDYLTDENHEITTAEVSTGVNGFNSITSEKSDAIFAKETSVYVNSYDDPQLKKRLDQQVALQKKATEIKQVQIQGVSDNPGVNLGQVIKVKGENSDYGSFRVISISHTATENGKYQNRFTGISADIDAYPNTNLMAFPKSESQVATVTDNADPDGMSRIKVQFPWQKETGEMTPWLRVLTPHAGGGKGFQFTPETGEEVIVGFEGGNAERPYVMGALFTGGNNAGDWKSDKNDIKAIQTRSGHSIVLNDKEGEGSITISDASGNCLNYNTAEKTVTISSQEKIILSSKYIALVGDDIEFHSKNTKAVSEEAFVAQTGGSKMAVLPDAVVSDSAEVSINGKETKINATSLTTNSKGETLINGALVKLNS